MAALRLVAPRTEVWTASASARTSPKLSAISPKSRYPSSSPVRSTVGTTSRTASQTVAEYSRYTPCLGRTKIACGHRRSASAQDIAEPIPYLRAS